MCDTSINGMRYQSHKNNNDNKTSCFILKTIHYKKRRREKNTMMILEQSNNNNMSNNDHQTKNIQCLLCRKIIESNVYDYQHQKPQNLNICFECHSSSVDIYDNNTIKTNNDYFDHHYQQSSHEQQQQKEMSDQQRISDRFIIKNCNLNDNYDSKSVKKLILNINSCSSSINNNYKNKNKIKYSKMSNWLIYFVKTPLLVVLLFNMFFLFGSVNAQNSSKFNSNVTAEPGVCHSIDIRNKPENLRILDNCTVIEGFLQILLIDKYQTFQFENYSFPNLIEVTDYVMFYRINGLLTLRKLFPNLRVIRGNHLFENQALIIYEMLTLEEIGLISLTKILRGAVRIEKNPNLCYVDTIDWALITTGNFSDLNNIESNKQRNACPVCPQFIGDMECPQLKGNTGKDSYLCWNADHCQIKCPSACPGNCYDNTTCCDEMCAGGCSGPGIGRTNCTTCKHMMKYVAGKKICVDNCTSDLYAYSSRSCITREACTNIPVPIQVKKKDIPFPFVARDDGVCDMHCLQGYFADTNNCQSKDNVTTCRKTCKKCEKDKCDKSCAGATVDSISAAQALKGCTKIEGNLEISIRSKGGTNIVRELENSLSSIEEITASLKIVRSYPLISLHFFKSLKRINGVGDESIEKSLVIIDNQNLQDLFNNSVIIGQGKIAFHYNPKLCLYKIEQFKNSLYSNITFDSEESMRHSNGDKIACNLTTLEAEAKSITHQFALLTWKTFEIHDERLLLGYVVYHTEAPFQNVTLYDGRDACGMDGWEIDDVGPKDTVHPLTKLKPYTQYAFYVKTLMISSEKHGGQSKIIYFKTLPDEPMSVQKLEVTSNASSEIVINFKPPKRFNGEPDEYEIVVNLTENRNIIYQRDYCKNQLKLGDDLPTQIDMKPHNEPQKDTCDCQNITCEPTKSSAFHEDEALDAITFEDKLHDWVYVKYVADEKNNRRKRRDVSNLNDSPLLSKTMSTTMASLIADTLKEKQNENNGIGTDVSELLDDKQNVAFKRILTNETKVVIKNLKHFSWYSISVKACRKEDPQHRERGRCSPPQYKSARTHMVPGADDITEFSTVQEHLNNSINAIKVMWQPPKDPNGLIVSYNVLYRLGTKTFHPVCIDARDFERQGHVIIKITEAGNYSVQVKANSMYGEGAYTLPQYQMFYEQPNHTRTIIAVAALFVFLCIAIAAGSYYYFRQKFPAQVANMKLIASVNPEYISMQYTPDEWEVPREKIIQLQELGQGSFGMVYEGIIKDMYKPGDEQKCAIKTVNENATDRERINFLKEASVMKGFDTHHVVKLLGVCSSGQPTLVVMELMGNGDLKGYLRSHRPDRDSLDGPAPQPPSLRRVYQMAIEIADGMAYLAFKKFVHRDLAARNCMVAEDLTVKIGDFGMTRDIYETDYYRKGTKGLLPVRWMAPESLKDGVFTSSSDVFSYGVVLWEMATLASQPYQGLSNDQVLRYVIDGGVMERPENCPDKLYDLMRRCWTHRPSARPTFLEIVQELHNDAHPSFRDLSFFDSVDGQRYLQEQQNVIPAIDDATTPLTRPEEEIESSIDDDHYLVNRTNSQHLSNKDISLQVIRSSQPLSGGIGSGIFSNDPLVHLTLDPSSYRIDEEESVEDGSAGEENDIDAHHHHRRGENEKDLIRLDKVTIGNDQHHLKNGDESLNRPLLMNNLQYGNSNNRSSSSSNSNVTVQQRPDDSVAITVPQQQQQQFPKYVELQKPGVDDDNGMMDRNQSTKLKFFHKFYNPNKTNNLPADGNSISRFDGEEDDEFTPINKEQSNINKITPTKYLPNKSKQKPNDEEELRPLSNGYVVQHS